MQDLFNNGDFEGALKELKGGGSNGGGSAGNPEGSTPNAGGGITPDVKK